MCRPTTHLFQRAVARTLPLVLLLVGASGTADLMAQGERLSESSRISLVTVMPGDAVHSLFGHSAIRVTDPDRGLDLSYSYGTFNFDDDFFIAKFALGRMDYYLSISYWRNALRLYRDIEERPAVEQLLDLSLEERELLFDFLQTNAREENRYYRYDFLFDNCSTRIRDALRDALGSRVDFQNGHQSNATFRQLLRPYLAKTPFLELGIDLLLGARVDRAASMAETTFLPDYLEQAFDRAILYDTTGIERSLVTGKDSLITIAGYSRADNHTDWAAVSLWVVCALLLLKTIADARRNKRNGMTDVALFGLVGLIGCFLLFMWFGTAHHVTASNWNLAWAWPTHLVYAAIIARREVGSGTAAYAGVVAMANALLIAMWAFVPQDLNESFLAVCVMMAARGAWTAISWRKQRAGRNARPTLQA